MINLHTKSSEAAWEAHTKYYELSECILTCSTHTRFWVANDISKINKISLHVAENQKACDWTSGQKSVTGICLPIMQQPFQCI